MISKGFTVVELLVAISLFVLLLVTSLSALSLVREQGYSLKCTANLRTIGISFRIWRGENNDRWPDNYNLRPGRVLFDHGIITSYEVMQCPSAFALPPGQGGGWEDAIPGKNTPFDRKFQGHPVSYGMNRSAWVSEGQSGYAKTYRFFAGRESRIPYLLDCKAWKTGGTGDPTSKGNVSYRHRGKANILFLDGHVEPVDKATVLELPLF